MTQTLDELRENMESLSDSELIRIVEFDYADYRDDALEVAREELRKRNISSSTCEHIEKELEAEKSRIEYAGFWKRLVAYCIDSFILLLSFILIGIFTIKLNSLLDTQVFSNRIFGMILVLLVSNSIISDIVIFILSWPYYALLESSAKQATIGKMVMGIIVTDLEGNRISFGKATERYFIKIISIVTLSAGYIMVAFTEKKQALHDMLADCLVIVKK